MSDDLSVAVRLFVESRGFTRGLQKSTEGLQRFGSAAKREFAALGNLLGGVQGQLATLGVGIGVTAVIAQSAHLDKSLTQIGQTAGATKAQVEALRTALFSMAAQSGQNVEDLKSGFNDLVQAGLQWRQAVASIQAINPVMAETGANARVLAGGLTVASSIFGFDLSKLKTTTTLLDKMLVAGREGNAELESLSSIFSRVGVNAKAANLSFDETLAFIEGLSKIEKEPERLATLADSTLRLFTNAKYRKKAADALGIRFFTESGARRGALDVLAEMSRKFKKLETDAQRARFISTAFGESDLDTQRGLRLLLSGGTLQTIRGMSKEISQASGTVARDLPRAINNAVDQVGRLQAALREAADSFAQPINSAISNAIQFLLDSKEQGGLGLSGKELLAGGAGVGVAGLLAYRYGGAGLRALLGRGAGLGTGLATGKALEQAAGVTPVYVVNMPSGGFGGAAMGAADLADDAGRTAKKLGRLRGASRFGRLGMGTIGGAGLMLAGAGAAGYGAGTLIDKGLQQSELGRDIRDAIGSGVAHVLAFFGNDAATKAIQANERAQKLEGTIKLTIDQQGRARVKELRTNQPGVDLEADTGLIMAGAG